jgi:transketolase
MIQAVRNDQDVIAMLKKRASLLRWRIIQTSHKASVPHLGSCLSCVDLLTALFFSELRIDTSNPRWAERDRFILSKGHGAPALFQVLALRGFYPESWLENYGEDGGIFAEHPPAPRELPGIEAATGSLGHGLPMGLGMALAARMHKKSYRVYTLLGDGECNEGTIWEAALLAAAQKVNNLCVLIDFNKWQATDRSQEVMALDPLVDKWRAFGWNTQEIDGHDMGSILDALRKFPAGNNKPTAIIAHTVKGSGISFMEDNNNWHYRIPSVDDLAAAKSELMLED